MNKKITLINDPAAAAVSEATNKKRETKASSKLVNAGLFSIPQQTLRS